MDETRAERHLRLVSRQVAMNGQTWQALQRHGVTEERMLRLDFTYRAPDRGAAERLRALLAEQTDYDLELRADQAAGAPWIVTGRTQDTTISPVILDQWVDWMVAAGLEHDCEFDGWGTQL